MDNFEKFMLAGTIFLVAVFLWLVSLMIVIASVEQKCTQMGYPEYTVTWNYTGYCISWIDATKVVIPLNELR